MRNHRILTLILLAAISILAIHVVVMLTGGLRADATSQDLYSLSAGTESILQRMQTEGTQPVEMRLYFSETSGKTLPRFIKDFITYERYLRHLLREYERAADGKIELRFIDPITDSDDEQDATKDGLEGRPINQNGDKFFFGLAVETQTGSKETIPFLWPNEQESIEYEITKRLSHAAVAAVEEDRRAVEPRGVRRRRQSLHGADARRAGPHAAREVGLDPAAGAGLQGVADPGRRRPPLARRLRPGDRDPSQAPLGEGAVGARRVGRDRRQGDRLRRPLLDRRPGAAEPAAAVDGAPVRAGVVARSAARGVGPRDAAADLRRRHRSRGAPAGGARRSGRSGAGGSADDGGHPRRDAPRPPRAQGHRQHPLLPRRRACARSPPAAVRGAGEGAAKGEADAASRRQKPAPAHAATDGKPAAAGSDGVVRTPLITTTASGSTIEIFPGFGGEGAGLYYTDLNNAAKMRDQYRPGNAPQVLAWQISGRLPSAFPQGVDLPSTAPPQPEGLPDGIELPPPAGTETVHKDPVAEADRRDSTVIVFSDVDLISDPLGFQRNILGIVTAANDNHKVLLNSVDHLLGDQELMQVRTARHLDRPFKLFDEIEADAEKQTLEREREIREQVEGFQKELSGQAERDHRQQRRAAPAPGAAGSRQPQREDPGRQRQAARDPPRAPLDARREGALGAARGAGLDAGAGPGAGVGPVRPPQADGDRSEEEPPDAHQSEAGDRRRPPARRIDLDLRRQRVARRPLRARQEAPAQPRDRRGLDHRGDRGRQDHDARAQRRAGAHRRRQGRELHHRRGPRLPGQERSGQPPAARPARHRPGEGESATAPTSPRSSRSIRRPTAPPRSCCATPPARTWSGCGSARPSPAATRATCAVSIRRTRPSISPRGRVPRPPRPTSCSTRTSSTSSPARWCGSRARTSCFRPPSRTRPRCSPPFQPARRRRPARPPRCARRSSAFPSIRCTWPTTRRSATSPSSSDCASRSTTTPPTRCRWRSRVRSHTSRSAATTRSAR